MRTKAYKVIKGKTVRFKSRKVEGIEPEAPKAIHKAMVRVRTVSAKGIEELARQTGLRVKMPEDEPQLDLRKLRVKAKDTPVTVLIVLFNIVLFIALMAVLSLYFQASGD